MDKAKEAMSKSSEPGSKKKKIWKRICCGLIVVCLVVLAIILMIWAFLMPTKPNFSLQEVTVHAFNATVPNYLTSNFHVSISSRNPNGKVGIYYDRLDAYITYQSQQVTLAFSIPPTYQPHKELNMWSPLLYGTDVPVAPYNFQGLRQDQADGNVGVVVRLEGKLRWNLGPFVSRHHKFHVQCPAFINFGHHTNGIIEPGNDAVKCQLLRSCTVSF